MKMSLGTKSLALFALSIVFLVLLTLFESLLSGMSLAAERVISVLLLVLPGLIGIVLGVLGVLRRESRIWPAIIGIILNALFVLFQTAILFFAG